MQNSSGEFRDVMAVIAGESSIKYMKTMLAGYNAVVFGGSKGVTRGALEYSR